MALVSQCLCGNARLQAVALNNPAMFVGETGFAVALVQKALADLGYKFPISMSAGGRPDGIFGDETFSRVKAFQEFAELKVDGIVGKLTISAIDTVLAKDEAALKWFRLEIRGTPAPGNLPDGFVWDPDAYRAEVQRLLEWMNGNPVFRSVIAHIVGMIKVRPTRSIKRLPHWIGDGTERLFYSPYLFEPTSPLYGGPTRGPQGTKIGKMIAFSIDDSLLHELVHAMLYSRGLRLGEIEVASIVHPPKRPGERPKVEDRLFFGNFGDFVSIVVSNTYKSAKFPDRHIDALSRAFARDPLLLDMDHHLGNAHRPLRSPETFHETPEIRALLLKMWEQKGLETFCKTVADADAPFNPLRDVKK